MSCRRRPRKSRAASGPRVRPDVEAEGGAEEADKGGINGIIGDGFSGFNFYDGITSLGPVEGFIGGTEICFGFIPSDMVEGEREFPGAIWIFLHGGTRHKKARMVG